MWLISTCVVRNFWVLIMLWSFVYGLEKLRGLNDSAIYNESGVHVETKHSLQTLGTVRVFHSD
jgi:hypothetical protein